MPAANLLADLTGHQIRPVRAHADAGAMIVEYGYAATTPPG
jgi:hypothetical protein